MASDATLYMTFTMTIPSDKVEELEALQEARNDPDDERGAYEIEQEIDAILDEFITLLEIHDLDKWELG